MNQKCQVFTPEQTVTKMLDLLDYKGKQIVGKRIIDLSCGDGSFFKEALKRLIKELLKEKKDTESIKTICNDSIFGFEIDKIVYEKCINNLNAILSDSIGAQISWDNIRNGDGLIYHGAKFDYVVGNPPYIAYRDIDYHTRQVLKNGYESCKSGRFDYSYAFIEKSIRLISDKGAGAIISPINFYKNKSGTNLRKMIKPHISKIIDVSNDNIFPGVLTNPVITIFRKDVSNNNCVLPLEEKSDNKKGIRFGELFIVSNGVATLCNDAFLLDCNFSNRIERELIKNARSPRFERYNRTYHIIYPYLYDEKGDIKRIPEEVFKKRYPNAFSHLYSFYDKLNNRTSNKNTSWFEYGRTQAINKMNSPKIMVSSIITKGLNPVLLGKNDIVFAGFYIVPRVNADLSYALKLLNSKDVVDYLKRIGIKMSGNSYRYGCKDLENYIIKDFKNEGKTDI